MPPVASWPSRPAANERNANRRKARWGDAWILVGRSAGREGGVDLSWLGFALWGRPDVQSRGPKIPVFKAFGTSRRKIGVPQRNPKSNHDRSNAPFLAPLSFGNLLMGYRSVSGTLRARNPQKCLNQSGLTSFCRPQIGSSGFGEVLWALRAKPPKPQKSSE